MERTDLVELHYIAPTASLPSIEALGILCHNEAKKHDHVDLSDPDVQSRRRGIVVPDTRREVQLRLHDYVNLYICGRNPMLWVIMNRTPVPDVVMLRISTEVLDIDGAVVTDGNAANEPTLFASPVRGLAAIDRSITFAGDPRTPDGFIAMQERKRRMMAEALIPGRVPPEMVHGVYVPTADAKQRCHEICGLETIEHIESVFRF